MDIQRQAVNKPWYLAHWYAAPLVLFVLAVLAYATTQESAAYSASEQNLAISTVKQGKFEVTVRGSGVLTPRDIRWLSANVSGRVELIKVKPGAKVKKGDLILQMSNPLLVQDAEEIAWQLEALEAENKALKVSLESQLLDQQALILNAEMNYQSAKINLDAQETLLNEGNATVSRIDHERSKLATKQFLTRWNIEKQRLVKLKENKQAQIEASAARFNSMQKSYARAQQQVESLNIMANLDGILQDMPLEAGQQVSIGDNIAKLAGEDDLIAELQISELQVRDVAIGQEVTIDTRHSEIIGKVIRIDPAVVNGVVQVDVAFDYVQKDQGLPEEARPDLTVDGSISVSAMNNALYVGRPTYSNGNNTTSVYTLSEDGNTARRTRVKFGIASSSEIQILEGLSPGQRIILSDSSAWEHLDQIRIQ